MDLECGVTIYIEATCCRTVELRSGYEADNILAVLTTEEARVMANALLAAVVEAESLRDQRRVGK